jgi:hypothetical protein
MDQGRVLEAERLTRAMETTRAKIMGTVGELRENVSRTVDWREQVRTHPGAALGAAATGGMLLGHWLSARIPPRAPRSGAPPRVHDDERTPQRGTLVSGPWTRAGSRVSDLLNRVIDELGDTVEKAAIPPLIARVQGFLQPSPKADDASPGPQVVDAGGRVEEPGVYPGGPAGRQSYPPHAGPPR